MPDAAGDIVVTFPRSGIEASELAVLVNTSDPQSVAVAEHYVARRRIPPANVVRVSFPVRSNVTRAEFAPVKEQIDAATPAGVQAYAVTWTQPYRIECMSVTTAIALGLESKYCK